jgi:endonuclease I
MLQPFCAAAALTLITFCAHADEAELLTGRLYAADALLDRMTGHMDEVRVIALPDDAPQAAREDFSNRIAAFRIAPGEAVERPEVRGAIARAALYMSDRYRLPMSEQDRQRYLTWNTQFPPERWERARNRANACVQGNGNPWIGPVKAMAIENCKPE